MNNISTEVLLVLTGLIAAFGAGAKEIIQAGAQRVKRNMLKRKISLEAHPIFTELKIYVTSQLPTWSFRHAVRRALIVDFEGVRWDYRLMFLKKVIEIENFDTLQAHELKDKIIALSISANIEAESKLLDVGFPIVAYQRFVSHTQMIENAMYSSLNSIFDSGVVFDSNRERCWAFFDQYISLFRQFKQNSLVALSDMNGELSNVTYETLNYKPQHL